MNSCFSRRKQYCCSSKTAEMLGTVCGFTYLSHTLYGRSLREWLCRTICILLETALSCLPPSSWTVWTKCNIRWVFWLCLQFIASTYRCQNDLPSFWSDPDSWGSFPVSPFGLVSTESSNCHPRALSTMSCCLVAVPWLVFQKLSLSCQMLMNFSFWSKKSLPLWLEC